MTIQSPTLQEMQEAEEHMKHFLDKLQRFQRFAQSEGWLNIVEYNGQQHYQLTMDGIGFFISQQNELTFVKWLMESGFILPDEFQNMELNYKKRLEDLRTLGKENASLKARMQEARELLHHVVYYYGNTNKTEIKYDNLQKALNLLSDDNVGENK